LHEWNFSKLHPELKQILKQGGRRRKTSSSKAGWLLKRGRVNTAYQKRWLVVSGDGTMSWFDAPQVWDDLSYVDTPRFTPYTLHLKHPSKVLDEVSSNDAIAVFRDRRESTPPAPNPYILDPKANKRYTYPES